MRLVDNPILRTHMRISMSGLATALVAISAVIAGTSLWALGADIDRYRETISHPDTLAERVESSRLSTVAFLCMVEWLVAFLGTMAIAGLRLRKEANAGLLDANRIAPLGKDDFVIGYWMGPAAASMLGALPLMAGTLAASWGTSFWFAGWLQTQLILISTGLLGGLIGVVAGVSGGGGLNAKQALAGVCLALAIPFALAHSEYPTTSIELVASGVVGIVGASDAPLGGMEFDSVAVFGFSVSSVALCVFVVAAGMALLWFMARDLLAGGRVRRRAVWVASGAVALAVALQRGMLSPLNLDGSTNADSRLLDLTALAVVRFVLVAIALGAIWSLDGERLGRLHSRSGGATLGVAARLSGLPVTLALLTVALGALALLAPGGVPAPGSLIAAFVGCVAAAMILVGTLEVMSLSAFRHAGIGIFFVLLTLVGLPVIAALVSDEEELLNFVLLVPVAQALWGDLEDVAPGLAVHATLAAGVGFAWFRAANARLGRGTPVPVSG